MSAVTGTEGHTFSSSLFLPILLWLLVTLLMIVRTLSGTLLMMVRTPWPGYICPTTDMVHWSDQAGTFRSGFTLPGWVCVNLSSPLPTLLTNFFLTPPHHRLESPSHWHLATESRSMKIRNSWLLINFTRQFMNISNMDRKHFPWLLQLKFVSSRYKAWRMSW